MSKTVQKTKICAGNGCSRDGIYPLKVIYLNKLGWFCESCKDDLILEGLAMEDKTKGVGLHKRPAPSTHGQQATPNNHRRMKIGNQEVITQTR